MATTRHLNMLLGADGSVAALKGKGGDGEEVRTFYRVVEIRAVQVSTQRQSAILGAIAN